MADRYFDRDARRRDPGQERGPQPNRQHDDWQNRQGGDWQERSRDEHWFARDDRESQGREPRDVYEDESFYANQGWARPSSQERDRDWGYYRGQEIAGDRNRGGERGLEIDYGGGRYGNSVRYPRSGGRYGNNSEGSWRNERDFGRGIDAERALSRQRGQDWDVERGESWNAPGPFSGVGPQGYQRSDERIKEEVCQRLTWHGQIDASNIEIDVKDGEVILRGRVGHKHEKRMAEDAIETVAGVKDIQNQIRVTS